MHEEKQIHYKELSYQIAASRLQQEVIQSQNSYLNNTVSSSSSSIVKDLANMDASGIEDGIEFLHKRSLPLNSLQWFVSFG